jgi:TPP-dependent pyruvate/acetoin dehydrogenase alpha subunit
VPLEHLADYVARLTDEFDFASTDIEAIDEHVRREVDDATDVAERSGAPEAHDALVGVFADPPAAQPLWFREGSASVVDVHERPEGWGTYTTSGESR